MRSGAPMKPTDTTSVYEKLDVRSQIHCNMAEPLKQYNSADTTTKYDDDGVDTFYRDSLEVCFGVTNKIFYNYFCDHLTQRN